MRRMVIFLLALMVLTSMNILTVFSQSETVDERFTGAGYPFHNPQKVLAVYDEEMAGTSHFWKDRDVDVQTYLSYEIRRGLYRFPFGFQIAGYETWDSDESLPLDQLFFELVSELNWAPKSYRNSPNGLVYYDILVAFTGQKRNGDGSGVSARGMGAALIEKQDWYADDNVVQHEVGHLYGLAHDRNYCVMNTDDYKFWYFYDELLEPIESGYYTMSIFRDEFYIFMVNDWCGVCWSRLTSFISYTMSLASYVESSESIAVDTRELGTITSVNSIVSYAKDTTVVTKELNTFPSYILPITVAIIGIAVATLIYLIKRKLKNSSNYAKNL